MVGVLAVKIQNRNFGQNVGRREWFERRRGPPKIPIPMKSKGGQKKAPAYMTAIVNMLIEANAGEMKCDYDPRALTTVTRNGEPLRTLSRRVDGAFPCVVNPIAVWEIKE